MLLRHSLSTVLQSKRWIPIRSNILGWMGVECQTLKVPKTMSVKRLNKTRA